MDTPLKFLTGVFETFPKVIIVAFLVEKVGNVPTASDGRQLVVNTRMELCGAFINKMSVTYVNYTVKGEPKDEKKDR